MTQTLNTIALNMLTARIIEERDALNSTLGKGQASSFDAYRYEVGRIRALTDVLSWAEDAEKNLFEGKKEKA